MRSDDGQNAQKCKRHIDTFKRSPYTLKIEHRGDPDNHARKNNPTEKDFPENRPGSVCLP